MYFTLSADLNLDQAHLKCSEASPGLEAQGIFVEAGGTSFPLGTCPRNNIKSTQGKPTDGKSKRTFRNTCRRTVLKDAVRGLRGVVGGWRGTLAQSICDTLQIPTLESRHTLAQERP